MEHEDSPPDALVRARVLERMDAAEQRVAVERFREWRQDAEPHPLDISRDVSGACAESSAEHRHDEHDAAARRDHFRELAEGINVQRSQFRL